MNRNNNVNSTGWKNKTSNRNKTNSASSSHIQSASSDVFENSDMDIEVTVNKSSKTGRNLSSSDELSTSKIAKTTQKSIFSTTNRYSCLATDDNPETAVPSQNPSNEASDDISQPIKPPPSLPPIMVQGVLDFVTLRNDFLKLLGAENFLFKSSTNDLKILTKNSDSYRAVIKYLNANKAEYHTCQQRENKAFHVVIRNIHPSTPLNEIGITIQEIGFTVRQVANVRHKITKNNLPLFFVNLEPAEINKDIFHVTSILHTKVRIEEPYKRREVIQCQNCQKYGHSKSYCSHPPRCVRCAELHTSSSCTKSIDQPPTCALCGGSHPANYRGFTVHKDLQKFHNYSKATTKQSVNINYNVNGDPACDHSQVLLNLNCEIYYNPPRPSLAKGPVNWNSFSKNLENATNLKISLKSTDQIDEAAQNLTTSIQTAVFKASYVTNTPDNSKHNILPPQIQKLIVKKRRVRSLWQRSNLPFDKRLLNYLSNLIKKLIIKHKSNFFQEKFQSLNSNDGSLWRTAKNILKIKEQATPLNGPNGELAISDKDKAELFGTHLSNIFTPHSNINPESTHLDNIARFLDSPLSMSLPAKHTTPNEIKHLISKLKPRKSPGYDLITNKILQHLPNKTLLLLTFIYNSMLRLSHFPQIWKFSMVILIHKPGKPKHMPSSYRPISLLPVLAKLFEKIIIKRIRPLIHSNNIIPHTQFGFRASHSTIHQIHRITDKIQTSFENKEYCPGVFLDVAQAFDMVWHDGLLYKLKLFLPASYYLIIQSYLCDRTFAVRQGDSISFYFSISAGVPQGSDLSPDLFNIYTSDISKTANTTIATYADDTAILSSNSDPILSSNYLQNHLNLINTWEPSGKF
ncbi:hypothetical protein QTP88_013963 [Uroleucon formosanum]